MVNYEEAAEKVVRGYGLLLSLVLHYSPAHRFSRLGTHGWIVILEINVSKAGIGGEKLSPVWAFSWLVRAAM